MGFHREGHGLSLKHTNKAGMAVVMLLEVRTEVNSYSLSKESFFKLSKNASNSRPTE